MVLGRRGFFLNFLPSIRNTLKGKLKGRKEKGFECI